MAQLTPTQLTPTQLTPTQLTPVSTDATKPTTPIKQPYQSKHSKKSTHTPKSGWLEKKSKYLGSWRRRWVTLSDGFLKTYKTQNKIKQTEDIDLKDINNVCTSGTLTFDLFRATKIAFSFRAISNKESQSWIESISKAIIFIKKHLQIYRISEDENFRAENYAYLNYSPSPSTTLVKLNITIPYGLPSPFQRGNNLNLHQQETDETILIHTNLKVHKNQLLRARFAQKLSENHPELLMYGTRPQYDNDQIIRIDLICIKDNETNENRVRLQCKAWGEVKNRDCNQFEYPIIKSLQEITKWCMEYQEQNMDYSKEFNNCRKFMIELCHFLQIKYPDKYPLEETWYAMTNQCNFFPISRGINDENGNGLEPVQQEDFIMSRARNGNFPLTKNISLKNYFNTFETNTNELQLSLEISLEEEPKFEDFSVNNMFFTLFDADIINQCQIDNVKRQKYKYLRAYTYCFIVKMGETEMKEYPYVNYKMMILFNVLLVKKNHKKKDQKKDKYYCYEFNISYEELNIIDSTIKNICGHTDYDEEYSRQRTDSTYGNSMEKLKATYWIKKNKKPELRHPDICKDACGYYAKYLQVLFCCDFVGLDYIYQSLKLPTNLVILLNKLDKSFKQTDKGKSNKSKRKMKSKSKMKVSKKKIKK